jgi:hypothetical protein
METHRLAARQHVLLAIGAILMLVLAGMFQCASLALGASVREVLVAFAQVLSVLCVSLLIEDLALRPLRGAARSMQVRWRSC